MLPADLVFLNHLNQTLRISRLVPVRVIMNKSPLRDYHWEEVFGRWVLGVDCLEAFLVPLSLEGCTIVLSSFEVVFVNLEHNLVLVRKRAGNKLGGLPGSRCASGAVQCFSERNRVDICIV